MKFTELLHKIKDVQKKSGTSTPYLCGGIPRDKVLNFNKDKVSDIDITTGDESIFNLAKEVFIELSKQYSVISKAGTDGHISIYLGNTKVDFSSNFRSPTILEILKSKEIDPTPMNQEIYSRDFTCNSLLLDFDLKTILDPTGRGLQDIKDKKIKTILKPEVCFNDNKNRIIRVIYLAAKLDFDVDPEIISFIKENKNLVLQVEQSYTTKLLNKAFEFNPQKSAELLRQMDLWDIIPISNMIYPFYKANVKQAQFFRNYDLDNNPTRSRRRIFSKHA